ncbi:MAG: DNA phosphorothioation system restriction enzyme, partial [Candidatus Marinimicrobia bacterium]|nr:DNA phosphorothioation system restriction enzyme [Candidatus Neomarinimicrobiota bacterium]
MLTDINILSEYRTGEDDPLTFYIACLQNSTSYDRAAGYFSSSSISEAAKGFAHFIKNDGTMRLIASPDLREEDIEAIKNAYKNKNEIIIDRLKKSLIDEEDLIKKDRLNTLAWLIAKKILTIKISVRVDKNGIPVQGIFHEKFGIFTDPKGNNIAFTGSSN